MKETTCFLSRIYSQSSCITFSWRPLASPLFLHLGDTEVAKISIRLSTPYLASKAVFPSSSWTMI